MWLQDNELYGIPVNWCHFDVQETPLEQVSLLMYYPLIIDKGCLVNAFAKLHPRHGSEKYATHALRHSGLNGVPKPVFDI
jgi:hypothetical protein